MNPRTGSLELIHRAPTKRTRKPALLFVHGAYVGAWCWDVHFLRYLAGCGFPSYALSLRGHGASGCDREFSMLGIDDYVDDVERIVAILGEVPVLIGHSMGGLVVARLLGRSAASDSCALGAVLMAPVPMTGLTPAVLGLAMHAPMLLLEMNQMQLGQARFKELTHIRRALFSPQLEEARIRSYFSQMQHEAQRALLEMSMLHLSAFPPKPQSPLLVLGAENDGFFGRELVGATARGLGAACEIFPSMAHAMMLEPEWRVVADRIAQWADGLVKA